MKNLISLLVIATLALTSCTYSMGDAEEVVNGQEVKLLVETRADGTAILNYPLTVYAFNAEGECAASQTIESADNGLALNLLPGSYRLTALAGTDGYTLPTPMRQTSLITMTGNIPAASALMSGSADVTLTSTAASVNIRLCYQVARLKLTLTAIPAEVTAVQVSFSPQHMSYSMQGNFSGTGVVNTVACTKQMAVGTWSTPEFHLFPGSGQQTIFSIALTHADGSTSTYGYTHAIPLLAATPYILSGSYKEGLAVNGTLTADGWNPQVNITFNFGTEPGSDEEESGEGDENTEGISVTKIPAVPSIWKGACVVGVSNVTDATATLLVMSVSEWGGLTPAEATKAISSYSLAELPGTWRLPTEAEVTPLRNARKALGTTGTFDNLLTRAGGDATSSQGLYLCTTTDSNYLKYTWGGSSAAEKIGSTTSFKSRAVRSIPVTITK